MPPAPDNSLPATPPPLLQNQDHAKPNLLVLNHTPFDDTFPSISNPWRDDITPQSNPNDQPSKRELKTPDPSLFDQAITASILDNSRVPSGGETKPGPVSVSKDVLSEFDPLVESAEEQAAHDAWETAESHPPPVKSSSFAPSPPAKDDQYPSAPGLGTGTGGLLDSGTSSPTPPPVSLTPTSSFPSLAALARTFSIPSFSPRARPLSPDVAKPIASPSTLSSFAAQQEQRPGGSEGERSPIPSGVNTPARRSGASSPIVREPGGTNGYGNNPAEGQFDFQKFLDQMKTRSAEPVSKYLRS